MISSTDTSEIVPALVAALATMEDIPKTRTADMGKYKYTFADLADVLGYLRPKLAEHGLAVVQEPFTDDKGTSVSTTILHKSGQWIESRPLRLPAGSDAQSHGSAITFARRYQLLAQLGLATEDDDGAAAKSSRPQTATKHRSQPSAGPSQAVTARAMAMFKEAEIEDRDERLQFVSYVTKRSVKSWSDITAKEADDVLGVLDNLIKGRVQVGFEDDGSLALKDAS